MSNHFKYWILVNWCISYLKKGEWLTKLKNLAKLREKLDWDSLDLQDLYSKSGNNISALAKQLNISDNALRKQLIKRNLLKKKFPCS